MVGLILAAGSGSRLADHFGKDVCKPLLKVKGKQLIEYSLENLFSAGVDRIYIVVGRQREAIEGEIGTEYKGIPVFYAVQNNPIGLVNAMVAAINDIDDDTVLQLSDEILVESVAKDIKGIFEKSGADFICGVTVENDAEKIKGNYSVKTNDLNELESCTEKPQTVDNNYKGTGFCVFSRECMRLLAERYNSDKNIPAELCDYINMLIETGKRGRVVEVSEKEYNINTAEDAAIANEELNSRAVK